MVIGYQIRYRRQLVFDTPVVPPTNRILILVARGTIRVFILTVAQPNEEMTDVSQNRTARTSPTSPSDESGTPDANPPVDDQVDPVDAAADRDFVSRRNALAATATSLLASTTGCLGMFGSDDVLTERVDERTGGTWRMHHGIPSNARTTDATGPAEKPSIEWRHDVEVRTLADPIVADSLVFETPLAGDRGTAIEVATGDRSAVPAIERGNEVVLGVDDAGVYTARVDEEGSALVARDRAGTGERWSADVAARFPTKTTFGDTHAYPTTSSGTIEAVALEDGSLQWQYDSPQAPDSVAASSGDVTFTAAEYLFDLASDSGARAWHREFDARTTTRPVRTDDGVVVGTNQGTVARLQADGSPARAVDVGDRVVYSVLVVDDQVVVTTDGTLLVVDPTSGERVTTLSDVGQLVWLTAGSERIYAVDRATPALLAIDQDDHTVVWRRDLPNDVLGGPVVLDDTILARLGPLGEDANQDENPELVALT
jgi:hypothetical protein